jgi:hypothetical protein
MNKASARNQVPGRWHHCRSEAISGDISDHLAGSDRERAKAIAQYLV